MIILGGAGFCPSTVGLHPNLKVVGGFNPSEKNIRQNGFIFPNFRGENSKNIFETDHHLDAIIHKYPPKKKYRPIYKMGISHYRGQTTT